MSRFFSVISTLALGFAASEVAAMSPYVKAAYDEVPADLKSNDPVGSLLHTALNAYNKAKADPAVVPSLTGILGAGVSVIGQVATSFLSPTATQEAAAPAAAMPAPEPAAG